MLIWLKSIKNYNTGIFLFIRSLITSLCSSTYVSVISVVVCPICWRGISSSLSTPSSTCNLTMSLPESFLRLYWLTSNFKSFFTILLHQDVGVLECIRFGPGKKVPYLFRVEKIYHSGLQLCRFNSLNAIITQS